MDGQGHRNRRCIFKSANHHKKLAEWYSQNLGIQLEPWGGAILKLTDDKCQDHGLTVWHVAEKNTEWFSPSPSSFMINYRIDNMAEMLADLKRNGVEILKGPESDQNGIFAWILDPDGNKVELWEPMPKAEKNTAVTIGARGQEPPLRRSIQRIARAAGSN